jgi:hypothetical protein
MKLLKFAFPFLLLGIAGCAVPDTNGDGGGKSDGGFSICPDHPMMCGGDCCGTLCVDTKIDPRNCGTCGKQCVLGEVCSGGRCACASGGGTFSPCSTAQTCCGGSGCKGLMTDANNCGGCGIVCGPGGTCTNGECKCGTMVCGAGKVCCNGNCTTSCVTDMGMVTPDAGGGGVCQCADHCVNDPFGICLGTDCCYLEFAFGLCGQNDTCSPNLTP